jgi:glycosyltransferase involved in cell wall biosynthesis
VLREAWSVAGLHVSDAALTLAGADEAGAVTQPWRPDAVAELGHVAPEQLRNLYGSAGVLVVPSVGSRSFREPWGLVVNEAMNQHVAILASDAVGAAAGGLVRTGRTGLVVPAGDPYALAVALRRLHADAPRRARLAAQGAHDVRAYTFEAWAAGLPRRWTPSARRGERQPGAASGPQAAC